MKHIHVSLALLLASAALAIADTTKEAAAMGMPQKIYTKGKMQRMDVSIPQLSTKSVVITRLDKGVEWTVSDEYKVYSERPIPLEYKKEVTTEKETDSISMAGMKEVANQISNVKTRKLEGKKTFAGYSCEGLVAETLDEKGAMVAQCIFWLAPLTGDLKKAMDEDQAFEVERTKVLWSKYPEAERKKTQAGMELLGRMMSQAMMPIPKDFPPSYPLALKNNYGEESKDMPYLFEVKSLSLSSLDDKLFEIPEGYKKVPDAQAYAAEQMTKKMMQGSGMEDMMKMLKDSGVKIPQEKE